MRKTVLSQTHEIRGAFRKKRESDLETLAPEGTVGYGIPTGAGLCISPDGTLEALGAPVHRYAHGPGGVVRSGNLLPRPL